MSKRVEMISTRGEAPAVSFSEAMKNGLAPDGGLYMPRPIPHLPDSFWEHLEDLTIQQIASKVASLFGSTREESETLSTVAGESITFDAPLVKVRENLWLLELFHGPTLAFKDFGARFMARAFAALDSGEDQELLILVATSGDTGSAVANGFFGVEGTRVCLLYPSGKVSLLQERQMTTLGGNVTALEVDGTFDDCQRLVKQAFSDVELRKEKRISSANSINIARLIPQSFYYMHALGQLWRQSGERSRPVFSVPSGNFGNLTAGLLAMRMGMPVSRFLAATNRNDVVPEYLHTGEFRPRPSLETISNAMDVGNPSNFERMMALFESDRNRMGEVIMGDAYDDDQTRECITRTYEETGYVTDPHTAVGILAAERWQRERGYGEPVIVLSTAHPAKFADVVEHRIGKPVQIPERLKACLNRKKQSISFGKEYEPFREFVRTLG